MMKMANKIFEEGGPHKVRRVRPHQYEMSIEMPPDKDGRVARECPKDSCSPGYFKVKPGTGITEGQTEAFCPYCRFADKPASFTTKEQARYAQDILSREATRGISKAIENGLGLGPSRKKKYGAKFLSIEMKYRPEQLPHAIRPLEEVLKRDVVCPHCGLDHSVYGLATWCADCGIDIFMTHVETEFNVIRAMLKDSNRREKELGARVAQKDIENALEDTVSVFEAALRTQAKRILIERGISKEEIEDIFRKKIKTNFQNVALSRELTKEIIGRRLFEGTDERDVELLNKIFLKRHPITHNLGVVDRKYLEKVRSGELEGRDIRVTGVDVEQAIKIAFKSMAKFHHALFP
jgi:hypothetical protein